MLDCELCTLTHSWVGGAVLVLALGLVLALDPPLGLAAMKASRVAAALPDDAAAEVADDDGEADPADGEPVCAVCAGDADED